jgi:hypothetical protein
VPDAPHGDMIDVVDMVSAQPAQTVLDLLDDVSARQPGR